MTAVHSPDTLLTVFRRKPLSERRWRGLEAVEAQMRQQRRRRDEWTARQTDRQLIFINHAFTVQPTQTVFRKTFYINGWCSEHRYYFLVSSQYQRPILKTINYSMLFSARRYPEKRAEKPSPFRMGKLYALAAVYREFRARPVPSVTKPIFCEPPSVTSQTECTVVIEWTAR